MARRIMQRFQDFKSASQFPRFPVPEAGGLTNILGNAGAAGRPFIGGYQPPPTEEEAPDIPEPEFIDPDDYDFFKNWKSNLKDAYDTSYDIGMDEIQKLSDKYGIDPALALGGAWGGGAYTLGGSRFSPALEFGLGVNDPYKRYATKHGYNKDLFNMGLDLEQMDMEWLKTLGIDELLRQILGSSLGGGE